MWVAEHYFDILGTLFHVRSADPAVGDHVHRLLAGFARRPGGVPGRRRFSLVPGSAVTGGHHLFQDCRSIARAPSWNPVVAALLAEINAAAVAGFTGFAVHAGVVAAGPAVIAFPAASGDGKSTLTAACVRDGLDYVSDEALCVEFGSGRVVPYPKPLALSRWSRQAVGLTDADAAWAPEPVAEPDGGESGWVVIDGGPTDPDEAPVLPGRLGREAVDPEMQLAHVVHLARAVDGPRLLQLPRSESMARLLGMSFNHYKRPQESFALVSRLAQQSQAWRLEYDDPRPAARLIRETLAAPG